MWRKCCCAPGEQGLAAACGSFHGAHRLRGALSSPREFLLLSRAAASAEAWRKVRRARREPCCSLMKPLQMAWLRPGWVITGLPHLLSRNYFFFEQEKTPNESTYLASAPRYVCSTGKNQCWTRILWGWRKSGEITFLLQCSLVSYCCIEQLVNKVSLNMRPYPVCCCAPTHRSVLVIGIGGHTLTLVSS